MTTPPRRRLGTQSNGIGAEPPRTAAPSGQRNEGSLRLAVIDHFSTPSAQHAVRRVGALTIAFLGIAAIVWHHRGPVELDTFVLHGYVARRHTALFNVASILTAFASPAAVAALGALVAGYLWRYRNDTARALVCLGAPATAGAIEAILKIVMERLRPATGALTGESGYGFPSGHTAGFAAFAFVLALTAPIARQKRRWATLVAFVLSVAIAATRVIVGAHYHTDVLGGLLLGSAVAVVASLLLAPIDTVLKR